MLVRLHYGHKQEEGVLTQTDGVKTGASVVRVILWTTLDTEPEGHAPALCNFLCVCVYVSRGVSLLSAFVSVTNLFSSVSQTRLVSCRCSIGDGDTSTRPPSSPPPQHDVDNTAHPQSKARQRAREYLITIYRQTDLLHVDARSAIQRQRVH